MDNLTHTLTGLMLARAGLGRLTPRAGLILMLAANAPDADIVSGLAGQGVYLDVHRGHSHSWALLPLVALVPVLIGFASLKWRPAREDDAPPWSWWKAWLASAVAVASHVLLDWTNNYGIRFGLPLDPTWHRLDAMFIVDPWVWLLLLFGVAGPFLSRLVSLEIGAKRSSGAGTAAFVLLAMAAYIGGRVQLHDRAVAVLTTRVFDGEAPRRLSAFPTFGNPLRWRGVAEIEKGYWIGDVNLLSSELDPAEGRVFYHPDAASPAIAAAKRSETFAAFLRFNAMPLWRIVPLSEPEGAAKAELYDIRFGDPVNPGFVASAVIEKGGLEREQFRLGPPRI